MSFDCEILADRFLFVTEFGNGEEWLIFVGGISNIFHVRAGMSKNPHEGGRTGAFPTATSSPRRNEQKSTRAMIGDPLVGHAVRMNEQKSTQCTQTGGLCTRTSYCAGMSKNPHRLHSQCVQGSEWTDIHVGKPVSGGKGQPSSITHCAQE